MIPFEAEESYCRQGLIHQKIQISKNQMFFVWFNKRITRGNVVCDKENYAANPLRLPAAAAANGVRYAEFDIPLIEWGSIYPSSNGVRYTPHRMGFDIPPIITTPRYAANPLPAAAAAAPPAQGPPKNAPRTFILWKIAQAGRRRTPGAGVGGPG